MKPAPFRYHAPSTVEQVVDLLDRHGPEARILAGGQSLLPILAMRLTSPAHLIDLNRIDLDRSEELARITVTDDGVRIGALVRHAALERHPEANRVLPILGETLGRVAHPAVRNRGTTVGSLAHADPAAEMPAVWRLLDGTLVARSASGERSLAAADFFAGPMETTLRHDELVVAAFFRAPPPRTGLCFDEIARRSGDYALAGVATRVTLDEAYAVASLRMSFVSVADVPDLHDLSDLVAGVPAERVDLAAVGEAAGARVDPPPDLQASTAYRRQLISTLARRTTRMALARARVAADRRRTVSPR